MRESALAYARLGWPIFRLSHSKVPLKGSRGFKDATVDEDVIRGWWPTDTTEFNNWNIGLACGHLIVIDCDGESALTEFKRICAERGGGIPRTACVKTRRGWHFYFKAPTGTVIRKNTAKRAKSGDPGIDINGARADGEWGSYVVAPPSIGNHGFIYHWLLGPEHLIETPGWLVAWCEERAGAKKPPGVGSTGGELGITVAVPPYIAACGGQGNTRARVSDVVMAALRAGELGEFLGALRIVRADCGYDEWFRIGAAIHDFDSGTDGLAIFKAWSWSAEGYRDERAQAACEAKWREYGLPREPGAARISKGTVYYEASQVSGGVGWQDAGILKTPLLHQEDSEGARTGSVGGPVNGQVNGHAHPLPQELFAREPEKVIHWVDETKDGQPKPTNANARRAIEALRITCRKDVFHEQMLLAGHAIDVWAPNLSDDAVLMLRVLIKETYAFDPGTSNTSDAAIQLCLRNQFNPVLDYLDSLRWDGGKRIGRWVVDYLGAEDTPLNCEFGRLMLIAAVRRARAPGTKFDQIIVFEGVEGTGKSSAIKILAGDDNFSDQGILAASDKEQQEAFRGVWLHEIAELAGMRRTDVERIKQFASRTEDRARPAYGRYRVDMKRRGIFIATTNESAYLKSETGNRRFWPIKTHSIDLAGLARDRDQLWAEAAAADTRGDSIELGVKWREIAAVEQAKRLELDPWHEMIELYLLPEQKPEILKTNISDILQLALRLKNTEINQIAQNRAARILQRLGFNRRLDRDGNRRKWIYSRD